MAAQTILITGASTGFGAMAARALAKKGHIVYAGMYSHSGDTKQYEDDAAKFSRENNAQLHTVPLNLLDQRSVDQAVEHVLTHNSGGHLDTVIHNAGHMNYGPAEAFTPEQYLQLYNVNVVGCQRLNQAALPHMRSRRRGHLIWISSSSVFTGKSPMLAGYFAAKAAMDALASVYATEVAPWGIETSIIVPGVFTSGTNHFADAMQPGRPEVVKEYEEGPTKGLSQRTMEGTASVVPDDADPVIVADAVVAVVAAERGHKPLRVSADAADDGSALTAPLVDRVGGDFLRRLGLENAHKIQL